MRPRIAVFADAPDRGAGHARDMRLRWALEEAGQPYDLRPLTFAEMKAPEHLARQPFGQIPSYEEGDLVLFETGAILLHLAERHPGLLPAAPAERARALSWLIAALATVEPPIVESETARLVERDTPWFADRQPLLDRRIDTRLAALAAALGDRDWLAGAFSIADVMMVTVLRRAEDRHIAPHPVLAAYVARGEARPAYRRAFAAQRALFEARRGPGRSRAL